MASGSEREKSLNLVYLLAKVGTDVIRKVFIDNLLCYFLEKNKSTITSALCQSHNATVYPTGSSPKLEDLDTHTLETILSKVLDKSLPTGQSDIESMRSQLENYLKVNFLAIFLQDKEKDLKSVIQKVRNDKEQLSKLYSSECVEVGNFDITILCFLLFQSFGLQKPTRGFKNLPKQKNVTKSDDIQRIKLYRNKIFHADKIESYDDTFDEIKWAIIRLGGKRFQDEIHTFEVNIKMFNQVRHYSEECLRKWQDEKRMNSQTVEKIKHQLGNMKLILIVLAVFVGVVAVIIGNSLLDVISQMPESSTFVLPLFGAYKTKYIQSNECEAIGTCQPDSIKCSGSFVINKCPENKTLRCCTSSYIIIDNGFCSEFGVRIISRDSWGAMAQTPRSYITTPVNIFLIHHTVSSPCNSTFECMSAAKKIQTLHMKDRNWSDIAYSFLVGEDGYVYEGRGWNTEGAHTRGKNRVSLAAAMIGNFHERIPNKAALTAVKSLIRCGVSKGMINSTYSLYGHRDFSETVSPGDALYNNMKTWHNFHRNPID